MAFTVEAELPAIAEVHSKHPPMLDRVEQQRQGLRGIIEGSDQRLIVVQGPCSFFPIEAGVAHTQRMAALQEKVGDALVLVERVYSAKPRTTNGWEGIQFNARPDLNGHGGVNIAEGIDATRGALRQVVPLLPTADEILNPDLHEYFNDLLSYGAIGARDATCMRQRRAAGGMEFPMGMKHDMSGDLSSGVQGVQVAQTPGNRLILNMQQQVVSGNPHAHLILRGSEKNGPNFDPASMARASQMLREAKVHNPSVIVDCSHANAIIPETKKKTPEQQILVVRTVIENMFRHPNEYRDMKGIMTENFRIAGRQDARPEMRMDGQSITDPCIGQEDYEALIYWIADELRRHG